jgi:hypothetical protein
MVPLFISVASSTKAVNRFFLGNEDAVFAQRVSIAHGRSIPFNARAIEQSSTRRGKVNLCTLDTKFILSTSIEKYMHLLTCGGKGKMPPCFDCC